MVKLLFLMTGGALGTLARYLASGLAHRMTGSLFPLGTLFVNSVGSLLIGIVWAPMGTIIGPQLHQALRPGWILRWFYDIFKFFTGDHEPDPG